MQYEALSRYQCHRLLSSQKYRHTLMSTLWTCSKSLLYGNTISSPCSGSLYPILQEAFPESCKPRMFCLLRALKTGWRHYTFCVYICTLLTDIFTSLRLYEVSNMSRMRNLKYHRLTNFPKITQLHREGAFQGPPSWWVTFLVKPLQLRVCVPNPFHPIKSSISDLPWAAGSVSHLLLTFFIESLRLSTSQSVTLQPHSTERK